MSTILTDDERMAIWAAAKDPRLSELELIAATEAAVLAKLRKQEPIYQIKAFNSQTAWHDATEGAYHVVPPSDRRIVYAAPEAPAQGESRFTVDQIHQALLDHGLMSDTEREDILASLGAAPKAPAQPSVPAPWREAVKEVRDAAYALATAERCYWESQTPPGASRKLHPDIIQERERCWVKFGAALAQLDSLESVK